MRLEYGSPSARPKKTFKGNFWLRPRQSVCLGGAAGILLGVVASAVVSRTLQWPSLISPYAIALAGMFAFGVGIVFGYYPARIASRLDPIEAIRYE